MRLNANLAAALRYARLGWPVFPAYEVLDGRCTCGRKRCSTPGKHPRTERGFKDATTDVERIECWWTKWPDANVAIRTGRASRLLVLDVDPRNGGTKSFKKALRGERPPTTPTVETGGGGQHLYMKMPVGLRIRSRGGLLPGLDVKADGGYVIAPPSTHRTGAVYRWVPGPDKVKLATIPGWLLGMLSKRARRRNVIQNDGRSVHQGQRNTFLVSLAGKRCR